MTDEILDFRDESQNDNWLAFYERLSLDEKLLYDHYARVGSAIVIAAIYDNRYTKDFAAGVIEKFISVHGKSAEDYLDFLEKIANVMREVGVEGRQ